MTELLIFTSSGYLAGYAGAATCGAGYAAAFLAGAAALGAAWAAGAWAGTSASAAAVGAGATFEAAVADAFAVVVLDAAVVAEQRNDQG